MSGTDPCWRVCLSVSQSDPFALSGWYQGKKVKTERVITERTVILTLLARGDGRQKPNDNSCHFAEMSCNLLWVNLYYSISIEFGANLPTHNAYTITH
jgi:hypothetical protein